MLGYCFLQCIAPIAKIITSAGMLVTSIATIYLLIKSKKQTAIQIKYRTLQNVFYKITSANSLTIKHANFSAEAFAMLWEARQINTAELPPEIESYIKRLFDKYLELKKVKDKNPDRECEIVTEISEEEPSKIFKSWLKNF